MTAMPAPSLMGAPGFVRMHPPRNRAEMRNALRSAAIRRDQAATVISLVERRQGLELEREFAVFAGEMATWAEEVADASSEVWSVD